MAYKPFQPNKGNHYAGSGRIKDPKNEIQRMKLFGFRTGAAWKMIPALFYYIFMLLIVISSILGEIREFQFERIDVVLCILKYLFIIILLFSPAIFLSDFRWNNNIPLFKNKTIAGNVLGMAIVIVFSLFMIWTDAYCMSDTYKDSADAYYQEIESKNTEKMKQFEMDTETQSDAEIQTNTP